MAGLKYWVWLSELKGLSNRSKLLALEYFGAPENIYYAELEEYRLIEGLPAEQMALLMDKDLSGTDKILGRCEKLGIRIVTMQDADYSVRLRNIYEPPCLLYVKGQLPAFDEEVAIAVVGTRKATPYGVESAEKICFGLARQGALVVSGTAHGIDESAHRGALRAGGRTVAVLGSGIDVVYPSGSEWLYRDIAAAGALISEYPPGTTADGWRFPVRNRILSGLCLGTLVVEAPDRRSGALITANTALEQGRDVFAVPGPIDAPMSRGCNRLISESAAALVCGSGDILREYEAQYPHKLRCEDIELPRTLGYQAREARQEQRAAETEAAEETLPTLDLRTGEHSLGDEQLAVLRTLGDEALQVDDIIERTGLPTRRVLSALTVLEIDGYVRQESGKRFSRNVILLED